MMQTNKSIDLIFFVNWTYLQIFPPRYCDFFFLCPLLCHACKCRWKLHKVRHGESGSAQVSTSRSCTELWIWWIGKIMVWTWSFWQKKKKEIKKERKRESTSIEDRSRWCHFHIDFWPFMAVGIAYYIGFIPRELLAIWSK